MGPLRGLECNSEDMGEREKHLVFRFLWTTPGYLEREEQAKAPQVLCSQDGNLLFAEEDIAGTFLPN